MLVTHDIGRSVSVAAAAGRPPAATLVYAGAPKSYFHPVTTPAGHPMTLIEPFDHTWHRGLWFTFKFVDGDNFWEEREPFGWQDLNLTPEITHPSPDVAVITMHLDWWMPGAEVPALCERRTWAVRPADDATTIDLDTEIVPTRDVTLDRTPYTTWGGYGGLAFRATPLWHPTRRSLGEMETDGPLLGETGPWCGVSGPLDGGIGLEAGLAILDHPANPRHPTPWYTGSGAGNFLNPSPLFHGPLSLAEGEPLRLRYRVHVHDGAWDADELRRRAAAYVADTGAQQSLTAPVTREARR